ncbi:chemotaxis protein CheA [Natribacillus halophilus]|uniref:Chemotaxis protein CheA n=1 Tax=Natribacillus halophilus TaxID=549003 RepID=A0A1G8LQJ2_9BACI|nr:chemotaxis protein CheA [Natribacillus halophilus]SDI57972.1 two-component system, chemotaxis family, sensor kinase CheA [Natribacillus halophilus]
MTEAKYLQMFIEEGQEHVQHMNEYLLQLEKDPTATVLIEEIFRSAHTLKGMAAAMEYDEMAKLTHAIENVLDVFRSEATKVTSDILDPVFSAVDVIEGMIHDIAEGGNGGAHIGEHLSQLETLAQLETMPTTEEHFSFSNYDEFEQTVLQQSIEQGFTPYELTITFEETILLKAARVHMVFNALEEHGDIVKSAPPVEELENENFALSFTVSFISEKGSSELEQILLNVSEVATVHIQSLEDDEKENPAQEQASDATKLIPKKGQKTIRVNVERLDVLMNVFEEWMLERGRLEMTALELKNPALTETVERMNRISSDLQAIILNMRMMPVANVFDRFPRMVRKVSQDLGKKVTIEIEGADTELDRTIIDEIGDPLVHLLRNSIDHGIELPDERIAAGKHEEGTIRLRAYHRGNHVYVEVADDGAGLNKDKIITKALERGLVNEEELERMSERQIYHLLFSSGFSTADEITDVSGRGVGLDVVRETFESLGGVVSVDSDTGKGSVFSIQLPLTLSIMDILLVQLQSETYGIPISAIMETAVIARSDTYSMDDREVFDFRGSTIPLIFLPDIFNVPSTDEGVSEVYYSIVIVRNGDRYGALVVDRLLGQKEVVLKSLGSYLQGLFAISGATILGGGEVALIIDTNELVQ